MRVLFFLLLLSGALYAQDISTPPVFNYACQIDSNCALYARLGITRQVDSHFVKGKYLYCEASYYDKAGQVIKTEEQWAETPGVVQVVSYTYNAAGMCVFARMAHVKSGDTIVKVTKRVLYDDTLTGNYGYENTYWTPAAIQRDSVYAVLELNYIDSKVVNGFSLWYTNRTVVHAHNKGRHLPTTGMIYAFHDDDSLFIADFADEGPGSHPYMKVTTILDERTRTYHETSRGRYINTRTWVDGILVEHHEFRDSVVGRDVKRTFIYNRLSPSEKPEVVIHYFDSVTVVEKGTVVPFVDYTPDSCRIDFPLPAPEPEFPTYDYYYSYHTKTPLPGGGVRVDFYNPYLGSALPLLRIWNDSRGVAWRLEDKENRVMRYTY